MILKWDIPLNTLLMLNMVIGHGMVDTFRDKDFYRPMEEGESIAVWVETQSSGYANKEELSSNFVEFIEEFCSNCIALKK